MSAIESNDPNRPPRVAVIHYSATGTVLALAEAVAAGAREAGADVRLRRVAETAPAEAIASVPAWAEQLEAVSGEVAEAELGDLAWADAYAFGTPTRYGGPAAQLKAFIDSASELWRAGELADKPVTSFTSAQNPHGGLESTILALNNAFYHWGCLIVPPGYTDELVFGAGGNPYGTSWPSGGGAAGGGSGPDEATSRMARYQGARLARLTRALLAGRAAVR